MKDTERTTFAGPRGPRFTLYGKGDTAFSMQYLEHKRDLELKGHKINCTFTADTFKTSTALYIEENEILQVLKLLLGLQTEVRVARNKEISGKNKSLTFSLYNGELLVKASVEGETDMHFKISEYHKIILHKLLITTLLQQFNAMNYTQLTKEELLNLIESHHNVFHKTDNTQSSSITVEDSESTDETKYNAVFVNTYNGKSYKNQVTLPQKIIDFISSDTFTKKIHTASSEGKRKVIEKIKKDTKEAGLNTEQVKFLNEDNIETLEAL